ncbi:phosphoribosyltransferase family protein [Polynucleobacter aenigmaticus]|uniref:phosphoribosyltransferase family protein n=1 Tax=Polynucleobacter aenigmaticus TaxID=1743164 RepID=UPI001F0A99A7|nr:phosphoribosyltransferase family protein [Polynucleobacter aenigmaticus]
MQHHLDYAVAKKVRTGDREVEVTLPSMSVQGRPVILLDDIASSGHTLARTTELLLQAGAQTVDVIVTHALFMGSALELVKRAGVSEVWSTDCIDHPSNAISMLPAMARAWNRVIWNMADPLN